MSSEQVIGRVQHWVREVVVGHNFCPFAAPSLDDTHYQVLSADAEQRLHELVACCLRLRQQPQIETALLIVPEGLDDFDCYLDQLALAEDLLSAQGFDGEFQLASFHPDYCFAGVEPEAAENYTNRSPYPIFHLLREASLSQALGSVTAPEKIPERNRRYAEQLGVGKLQASLKQSQELD
ncbi:MAG: DUF1415 domain-containing protein [Cellvibrionaceae bacterium]|nr:DUF1415 domain-containing protein [Cellvibrionaceae bacterium]